MFQYEWFVGGRRIHEIAYHSENEELVEDLSPVGKLIKIRKASVSKVYTCVVSSPWGIISETVPVTVISGIVVNIIN